MIALWVFFLVVGSVLVVVNGALFIRRPNGVALAGALCGCVPVVVALLHLGVFG